jgi:hypothetical protein
MNMRTLPLGLLLLLPLPAADYPTAEISNGEIRAKIYLPDAKNGFYRSTRFDWSGVIGSLVYKGHEYYAPWFQRVDPKVNDFAYDGKDVVVSPYSASVGPTEEFQTNGRALGFDEAKPGGTFIKIGVGVLRRPDASNYDKAKPYEIVDAGKRSLKRNGDSVEFTHELSDPETKYGYVYRKTVRLTRGKPQMVIEHALKNTGTRAIQTTVYNHNFLVLDNQPPGPDFVVTLPFQLQARRAPESGVGEIRGNQILYLKTLTGEDRMTTSLQGLSDNPKDFDVRVENKKIGVGYRVTSDRPMSSLSLWSIRTNVSVEPFHAMTIEPGREFTWNLTYDYYTLPWKP